MRESWHQLTGCSWWLLASLISTSCSAICA